MIKKLIKFFEKIIGKIFKVKKKKPPKRTDGDIPDTTYTLW